MRQEPRPEVWVVEDDPLQQAYLVRFIERTYTPRAFSEAGTFLQALQHRIPDVVLLDHRLPDRSGLEVLQEVHRQIPFLPVIMITAYGRIEDAVEAMRSGAFYYLTKPVDFQTLDLLLQRALSHRRLQESHERMRRLLEHLPVEGVVQSPAMQRVMEHVRKVAPTEATVLITGESGTGKEWLARLIHTLSPRKDRPFVPVHIAALPEHLVEAELFGYEKGAFTDAHTRRIGKLEAAHGGTLFLDEIGELSPSIQVKLLRFLQDRTVERLGSNRGIPVDVRIIAATNRDIEAMVREGRFREDLFYRLNVVRLHLPPLRERREDILPLAEHYLNLYARKYGKTLRGLDREVAAFLMRYPFPGNVRELQNMMERAVVMAEGPVIRMEDLALPLDPDLLPPPPEGSTLDARLREYERRLILEALEQAGGVQTQAARILGLSERALRYRMARLGIRNPFRS